MARYGSPAPACSPERGASPHAAICHLNRGQPDPVACTVRRGRQIDPAARRHDAPQLEVALDLEVEPEEEGSNLAASPLHAPPGAYGRGGD